MIPQTHVIKIVSSTLCDCNLSLIQSNLTCYKHKHSLTCENPQNDDDGKRTVPCTNISLCWDIQVVIQFLLLVCVVCFTFVYLWWCWSYSRVTGTKKKSNASFNSHSHFHSRRSQHLKLDKEKRESSDILLGIFFSQHQWKEIMLLIQTVRWKSKIWFL